MTLPPVPPGLDYRLEYFLTQIRSELSSLNKKTGDTGTTTTDQPVNNDSLAFLPVYATSASLVDQSTGTENAWTTLASTAPADARFAIIIFEVSATDDADIGDLKFRQASGEAEVNTVYVNSDQDDASPRMMCFVPLDASGQFQYNFTNTSVTTINWSIWYTGYVQ